MTARVFHYELWGRREGKYEWLLGHTVESTPWTELEPEAPLRLFRPYDVDAGRVYQQWPAIHRIMPVNSVCIVTSRDHLVIDFDRDALRARIEDFIAARHSHADVRARYLRAGDKLDVGRVREELAAERRIADLLAPILYRPFDIRFIFYHDALIERSRRDIMPHLLAGDNVGLIARRQMVGEGSKYFFASSRMIADGVIRSDNRGSECLFPLFMYPAVGKVNAELFRHWPEGKDGRRPNLDPGFVEDLAGRIGLRFVSDGRES